MKKPKSFSYMGTLLLILMFSLNAQAQDVSVADENQLNRTVGTIHLGTYELSSDGSLVPQTPNTRAPGDIVWDNTAPLGTFRNSPLGEEVLDEGDTIGGTYIGEFQVGFATDATGSVTLQYNFYENNNFGTVGDFLPTNSNGIASYDVTVDGLTGGGILAYTLNVALPIEDHFIIEGPDTDGNPGVDWGYGIVVLDAGNSTALGPLISGEGPAPGAPGRADLFDVYVPDVATGAYSSTLFFGGAPFAQFHMQVIEGERAPATPVNTNSLPGLLLLMLMLGMGSLMVLRQRA